MLPFCFWSGLRDWLGSLLRSPTRTRPTNSPPDCSLLRNGLFESLIPQPKNKKGSNECFLFVFGADYETRTRYLHLGKVTLYRMS